jgi:hypothetical protein
VGCGEAGAVSHVANFEAEDDLVSTETAAAGLAAEDVFLLWAGGISRCSC